MAVSGTINVSMSFVDSTTSSGVVSEKKAALSSADVYTSGKVAVVSGVQLDINVNKLDECLIVRDKPAAIHC